MELALLITLTGVLWGMGPVFDKIALGYFSSENTIFLRVMSGAVIITLFTVLFGNVKSIPSEFNIKGMAAVVASGMVGFGGVYAFYRVINNHGAQISISYAIALAICPVVTAICAHFFFGESILRVTKIAGLFFIVAGIYLMAFTGYERN